MLGDYQVNVHHLLAHLACLLAFLGQLQLDLLLAGEDTALCATQPQVHIIVQVQMEATKFTNGVLLSELVLLDGVGDEDWDLLNYLV